MSGIDVLTFETLYMDEMGPNILIPGAIPADRNIPGAMTVIECDLIIGGRKPWNDVLFLTEARKDGYPRETSVLSAEDWPESSKNGKFSKFQ
jgi:hypothetical protein